ncbi:unnamed protein product [Effrenium voratum]|uniref:DZANK-type domain-containing protein n=1 Tax=Effrenium voratum TaxID=2562239 RepID=A0AA36IXV3_9DINO|nr:unnamed protein product [Effrenium voratum]
MGTVVQVLEVVHRQDEKRVRGRIEEPAGWISIVSTEDGNRWAQRDLARSNRWAVNGQEQLQSLRRELQLLEAASKDAEEAQRMQELQTARETAEAERAEEMDRRERELREMQDRLRKTELQLHSAQVAADGPGVYVLQSDVDLSEGCQRNSKKVGRLSAGQEVQVLEVALREAERRVRGRLSGGWISLLDTAEGYRWAQKQLFATNEWIGQLTANAGLTEMKARCAGLEAQRDSLLEELNNASARPQGKPLAGSDESEELQALRGKVVLLEAGREEAELQAELLRTKYQTLEAELEEMQQDSSNHVDSAAARGLSLQAEELRRQLQQQVQERGKLEAELARLRAEELALHAEVEELRAATVSSPTAENPLTAAERWVLYTEVPKVEGTPSMTYFGKIKVDFDDEALGLGPLASVNFAQRAAASAAVERGDALRAALRHFREAGGETSLDPKALRDFLTKVFQEHGLTPPLEPHIKAVYDLFNPPPAEPRLDALHCLGLTDALLRAALRTKPKAESTTDPCCSCGELYEEDSNFCIACGEPRPSPVKKTVSWAPKVHLGPTMQKRACEGCQQPLTEDSTFCSMCGRVCGLSPAPSPPVKMVPQLAPYAPVAPLETLAPSRPLDATRIRGCRLAAEVQASSPGVCAFREVAAASLGTRPM